MSERANSLGVKQDALREILAGCVAEGERLLVAYSGGTDSAYLAWAANDLLGARMMAVIADSPSLPRKELAAAIAFANEHGIALQVIATHELEAEAYARNDASRCFHCKDELFRVMQAFAGEQGAAKIAYGRNVDDAGEFRPGQRAAAQHAVLAPLVDAGLGKTDIRALAQQAGLTVWDKPAAACLASRVEYGRTVNAAVLMQVEAAEEYLHVLGFRQVRVRHHGEIARIEIDRAELGDALSLAMLERMTAGVKAVGFKYVALDTSGYRSGSMNDVIPVEAILSELLKPMHRDQLLELLRRVHDGRLSPDDAANDLATLPFEDIGFAKIDHHRALRSEMPEVIFAAGKTPEQTAAIFERLQQSGVDVLATRVDEAARIAIQAVVPEARYEAMARCVTLRQRTREARGHVVVMCAGTSDLPVAEEAAVTAELFGSKVTRICDVGVAGIHRLLAQRPVLETADVVVVCAGMEGALPSVVGGLVGAPVLAVPTSVGYGASFGGVAALLGMLNACSPNISVMNIDNGFGAGYMATLIARRCNKSAEFEGRGDA